MVDFCAANWLVFTPPLTAGDVAGVIADINETGYGLTFGLHTRIDGRVQDVVDTAAVGNLYINRNQIGAVVGSQPFGGQGLSGTGPKAGGPFYLERFRQRPLAAAASPPDTANTVPEAEVAAALAALDMGAWAARRDQVSTLRDALRGRARTAMSAAAALDMGPIDLPGPTGESNRLWLAPRGRVLCLGPSADALLDQAVQALRAGNGVVAVAPDAMAAVRILIDAGLPLFAANGGLDPAALARLQVDAVASEGGGAALRQALAARAGARIPLIARRIDCISYAHERVLCIDTTAAGGNASLLAMAG